MIEWTFSIFQKNTPAPSAGKNALPQSLTRTGLQRLPAGLVGSETFRDRIIRRREDVTRERFCLREKERRIDCQELKRVE